MQLEPKHWKIVTAILTKYPYAFYAFGSRVHGKPQTFSDLDLCFMDPLPSSVLDSIEEDFEQSDLPFKVDLVDWAKCDETFRAIIQKHKVCIQQAPGPSFHDE